MPEDMGDGGRKMPSWVWLAVGGGALLLVLMTKGSGNQSSTETDNLLAAELDAALKAAQENQEARQKEYEESQKSAWEDFKTSLIDLLNEHQGNVEPPSNPTTPPSWWTNPPPWWYGQRPPDENQPPADTEPGGSESKGIIPGAIEGGMFDNFVSGFDYRKTKGG